MKHLVLFLVLYPLLAFAHREDPRERKEAPYPSVKTVEITTFFKNFRDGEKLDTGIKEMQYYNPDGLLLRSEYRVVLDKGTFYSRNEYNYVSEDAWTKRRYSRNVLQDSAVVHGGWANLYSFKEGKISEIHEYRFDSTQERVVTGGDTINRKKVGIAGWDSFWDYYNAGTFAGKQLATSVDTDTTRYMDAENNCMVMIVNHYDNNFRPVQTEYYNYRVKKFEFMRLPYTENLDMIFFLEKSKKANGRTRYCGNTMKKDGW